MKKRILVIDDDEAIHKLMDFVLEKKKYQVLSARTAEEALEKIERHFIDAIILDRMLNLEDDGMYILEHVRSKPEYSAVPVIVLSGKGENQERVFGLNCGADDYITKPFDKNELLARLEAIFRRIDLDRKQKTHVLCFGKIRIDTEQHKIWKNDKEISLKPKEYDLLVKLAKNPGKVFSREEILETVWGYENSVETRTVDVHIQKIRQKISADTERDLWIETIRGYGYRFKSKID